MTLPRTVADVLSTSGFGLTVHLDPLDAPLHSRKPRRVFVNGMSDLSTPACPYHSSGRCSTSRLPAAHPARLSWEQCHH
jgi:hypothetical protein